MKNYSYMLWVLIIIAAVLVYLQSFAYKNATIPETPHIVTDGPVVDTVPFYPNNSGKE